MDITRRCRKILHRPTCCGNRRGGVLRQIASPQWTLLPLVTIAFLFSPALLSVTPESSVAASQTATTLNPESSAKQENLLLAAEGLTKEQGDAILQELRSIRELLQKQQQTPARARKPTSARVSIGDSPALGQIDAPVTMVEFTDYQCPYCKRFHDSTFKKLQEKYIDTGKLRYVSMDLPLSFHKQAKPAAHAARCVAEQNPDMYWEMRTILFNNARALGSDALAGYAGDLSLDTQAFQACMEDKRHEPGINRDIQIARGAGFTGTPSFVIGKNVGGQVSGAVLIGAKSLAEFESQIERQLPKAASGG